VLRGLFGPKRDDVMGEWRKLHNEELRDLYTLPSIIRTVKSMSMRWAVSVALMGAEEHVQVIGGKETTRKTKT
jgi:hypothetical protein